MICPECQTQLPRRFALVTSSTTVVVCPQCVTSLKPTTESRSTYMISLFGGGLTVGAAVLAILVIHGLNTGTWLAKDIVTAATILLAVILAAIAGAIAIQFERVKES